MKWRLFLTYLAILIPSLAMQEFVWWFAMQVSNLDGSYIWNIRFIPFILAAFFTLIMWAIWNFEIRRTEQSKARSAQVVIENTSLEKRKRERLDTVLHDLSDDDLLRLKKRLMDGTINDERLEDALMGEDGELKYGERR
jgi:hypothetical protein